MVYSQKPLKHPNDNKSEITSKCLLHADDTEETDNRRFLST